MIIFTNNKQNIIVQIATLVLLLIVNIGNAAPLVNKENHFIGKLNSEENHFVGKRNAKENHFVGKRDTEENHFVGKRNTEWTPYPSNINYQNMIKLAAQFGFASLKDVMCFTCEY